MAATSIALRSPFNPIRILSQTRLLSSHPNQNPNPQTPQTLTHLHSAIKSEPDPTRIADLFQSSAHLHHHRPLLSLALRKLSLSRRPDLIVRILSALVPDPLPPRSEPALTRILTLYSQSDLLPHALHLFHHQIPHKTNLSFAALLSALLHHSRHDDVIHSFLHLPSQLNLSPGLAAHNSYLKALCAKGDVAAARNVLDEMSKKRKLRPDIESYNAVLAGYLASKDEAGFDGILEEIAKSGLEPNHFTYNCRISMLCSKSQNLRAEELLEVMVSKGLCPDLTCFNGVIEGFCREGDVGSAVMVFKRMRVVKRAKGKEAASPDGDTYGMLVRSLVEKGEFGLGVEICRECLLRKFAPPVEAVKGLVEGLVKSARVEEAKGIVEKMRMAVKGDDAKTWKEFESALAL